MATESSVPLTGSVGLEWNQKMGMDLKETISLRHEGPRLSAQYAVNGESKELSDSVNSEVDAEGEEIDEEYVETYVGSKLPAEKLVSDIAPDTKLSVISPSPSAKEASSVEEEDNTTSTGSSSDAESHWTAENEVAEDAELEDNEENRCVFCHQDEDHDPNVDFEECLDCIVCGNIAHRQCARNADFFNDESEGSDRWRCTDCVANGLEDAPQMAPQKLRRRSSAPKLTRDLLPAHRGSVKPDSHSVFNTLILDDDPMDGSRSLRKRKQSGEDIDETPGPEAKKQRCSVESSACRDETRSADKSVTLEAEIIKPVIAAEAIATGSAPQLASLNQQRSTRRQRSRKQDKASVTVRRAGRYSMIASFHLDSVKLQRILRSQPRRRRKVLREKPRELEMTLEEPSHYPALQMSSFVNPFFTSHDRLGDDIKSKPYGGILGELEADTSKTFPLAVDRRKFENARQKAEEEWKQKIAAMSTNLDSVRILQKVAGPPSKIRCINFGGYEIDTWHAAPYPEEYSRNRVLYICEFCLKYMSSDYVAWRHNLKCAAKHPPGDEIYRDGKFSFFEVDGRKNPVYCQNLCLLAKLFLGSKTLYYDVEPFLFYIMTENDEYGCHFVGYFSKEKRQSSLNNVSCILVLPIHQRRGFGHLLIDFSYQLTRVEKKAGSPEKPLSDMGLVSYRSYWRLVLCYELLKPNSALSISELSERTGMTADDIISALEALRALVRDPESGTYALRVDYAYMRQYVEDYERKGYSKINPDALVWTPYVMGRNDLAHYEEGPSLQTVAPREEEDQNAVEDAEEGVQIEQHIAGMGKDTEAATPCESGQSGEEEIQLQQQLQQAAEPAMHYSFYAASDSTQPSTPVTNGTYDDAVGGGPDLANRIPPTRFQVWPPVQKRIVSTTSRRRAGRPFGSRRRTFTPARRRTVRANYALPRSAARNSMTRRSKSKLGGEIDGADDHRKHISNNAPCDGIMEAGRSELPSRDSETLREQDIAFQQTPNGTSAEVKSQAAVDANIVAENGCNAENKGCLEDCVMESG